MFSVGVVMHEIVQVEAIGVQPRHRAMIYSLYAVSHRLPALVRLRLQRRRTSFWGRD